MDLRGADAREREEPDHSVSRDRDDGMDYGL